MITAARYVIAVPNLQKSAAFYRDVMGFTVHEIGDPGWCFFVKDGFAIMAGECPDAIAPGELEQILFCWNRGAVLSNHDPL